MSHRANNIKAHDKTLILQNLNFAQFANFLTRSISFPSHYDLGWLAWQGLSRLFISKSQSLHLLG